MDKPLTELSAEELQAKRAELLTDRDGLQAQIVELMHRQAAIDNELAMVGLLIDKAKRSQHG
jgi:hypothetical protein